MSLKNLIDPAKLILCSSSARQRNSTISPNMENDKRIGDYLLLSTLGRGTFSKVKLAIHLPTRQKVAIKILDQEKIVDDTDIERINREIKILSLLHHENIVQLYETIKSNNNIYIVMEYIEGKDLFQYIYSMQRLTEYKSSQLFRQLISCLEYIHKHGIVHRDIKPENILLDKAKKNLKLVDFGLGNIYGPNELIKTACGSPCYAAPEMLSNKPYEGFYSDLWSCGVVLYCMLVGSLPFDDEDIKILYHNIRIANYVMPNFLSNYAQDILGRILVTNPKKRIKIDEIKMHPFYLMSERIKMYKEVEYFDDNNEIIVDNDIVIKMKNKFFKNNDDINYEFIIDNVKNNLHNKITTIYYLMCKGKNKNKNNFKNIENKENKDNKNNNKISFMNEKNQSLENSKIENKQNNNSKEINEIKNNNYDNNNNKDKKILKIHNIKNLLFNNSKKVSKKNTITRNENHILLPENNPKENITFNNGNNEKNFNILVINNFMQEKIAKINTFKPALNYNKIVTKLKNKNNNYTPKATAKNKNKYDSENNEVQNNSKNNNFLKNMIINRIVNSINKNNTSKKMKKLHSVNHYQKIRVNTSPNNAKNNINLSFSINNTINNNNNSTNQKNNLKHIVYNTNKSKNNKIEYYNNLKNNISENNNYKILGVHTYNIKPFQKCKKINFDSLDNKISENLNYTTNNAIKNENMHRQNYILSKIVINRDKRINKSINLGNNQKNGNNKFKKYMNKLLDEDSFKGEIYKNKTMNLTPILRGNYFKNKNEINESNKNNSNNKIKNNNIKHNIFPIKFDYNLIKKNKITNLFEYYRTNGLKQYIQKNNININNNNLNKKNNNININLKTKYDLEEKLSEYMSKRFKNYIKRTSTNKSKNNNNNYYKLYLNSKNNNNIHGEKNSISPNSYAQQGKKNLFLNKSYIKNNNNRIIFNSKQKINNNSMNKNRKNKINNMHIKTNNINNNVNFLLTTNFNNIIKKSISKNKNIKNRNNINLITYNSIMNNDELKNNHRMNQEKRNQRINNNGYNKTSYHSRDKNKNNYESMKYSPINKNNIINTNIYEYNINNNSKGKNNLTNYEYNSKKYNNDFDINNFKFLNNT